MFETDGASLLAMLAGLAGGVALLLFGLDQITSALRSIAGDRLRVLLARVTSNRWLGVTTGAITTAVVQSSSATTVLVVGFVSAGLMTLVGSLGVILGSNVGTTITAQVVAFDVVEWALAIVAVGFVVMTVARADRVEGWGRAVFSLGLVFVGMGAMGAAMEPLRDDAGVVALLTGLAPAAAALAGAGFTALVQSSSATTVLAIVLASEGLLTLEAGTAVVIGANVGTCVTAMIAAIGRTPDAKRAAVAHVLFNVVGAAVWLILLEPLVDLAEMVSPTGGTGPSDVPRQLANAHTIFNVANVVLFVWFLTPLAAVLRRIVPDRVEAIPVSTPRHLDPELFGTPALALAAAKREVGRLGDLVVDMVRRAPAAVLAGPRYELERLRESDADVDELYDHVIAYLARLSQEELGEVESHEVLRVLEAANGLESIADLVETNIVELGEHRLDVGVRPAESTRVLLEGLFLTVTDTVGDAVRAVVDDDEDAGERVQAGKADLNRRLARTRARQAARLPATQRDRRVMYAIETDLIEVVKRIEYLARRIVRPTIPDVRAVDEP